MRVTSRYGSVVLRARLTDRVARGTLFATVQVEFVRTTLGLPMTLFMYLLTSQL